MRPLGTKLMMRIHMMATNSLSVRLREERKRLDMTQQEIADKVSVTRETWSRYESAKIAPGSEVLLGLVKLGVDTNYVLTGTKVIPIDNLDKAFSLTTAEETGNYKAGLQLTQKEIELIRCYRKASDEGKKSIDDIIKLLSAQ